MTFRFVHISDLHLPPLPAVGIGQIANKRLLGYLSWHRKRKHRHRPVVVAALEKDLAGQGADHISVTGDITNLGLPAEFRAADDWLAARAPRESVSFVPGNHDAYVAGSLTAMHEYFGAWLPEAFPCAHRRGNVLFIGLSTAVATLPFLATGRVGREQLTRLSDLLEETAGRGLFRVLLLHHPPGADTVKRRKALVDAPALRRLLAERPVDLVLHGHGHHAVQTELPTPAGPIPVFGAGAASLSHPDPQRSGHYHVFELDDHQLRVTHRRYRPALERFEDAGEVVLLRRSHAGEH